MASINKVFLLGNVGNTPEMRFTASGTPVTTFSLATDEYYNGERQTQWHNVIVWGKLAETCSQYLDKGRLVHVEGKLQYRSWNDQDGQKHYRTEIVARSVTFIAGRPQDASASTVSEEPGDGEYE